MHRVTAKYVEYGRTVDVYGDSSYESVPKLYQICIKTVSEWELNGDQAIPLIQGDYLEARWVHQLGAISNSDFQAELLHHQLGKQPLSGVSGTPDNGGRKSTSQIARI